MTELTDEAVKALLDRGAQLYNDAKHHLPLQARCADLARALLDARAEHAASLIRINAEAVEAVAQARADAQAAVALALEEAAENKEQLEIWAHEILVGLAFADVLKIDSYNDKIEAHDMVGRGLVEVIRALAPADGLALVRELRERAAKAESERRMIVSHATMGNTDGEGMSVNDVSVQITALRNELYLEAKAERDTLAAANAALEARVARVRDEQDAKATEWSDKAGKAKSVRETKMALARCAGHYSAARAIDAALASGKPGEAGNG